MSRRLRVEWSSSVAVSAKDRRHFERLLERFAKELSLGPADVALSLVGKARIRTLNKRFRKKDRVTDVLSFPLAPGPKGSRRHLGDIVVALPVAKAVARTERRPWKAEVARYLAHGMLHLLGFDHETRAQARVMRAWEERLLGERGMVP